MTWLTDWVRRKFKTINGTVAGYLNSYPMALTIYKGIGVDTDTSIYLGGNVRNDFGDVRFTMSDGETLLDYYIESYISGISANILINVRSIPKGPDSTSIYIYYDNPGATSISKVIQYNYSFFEDFGSGTIGNWQITEGSWNFSNGYAEGTCGHCGTSLTRYINIGPMSKGTIMDDVRFPLLECRGGGFNLIDSNGTSILGFWPGYCVPWGGGTNMGIDTPLESQVLYRNPDTAWHNYKVSFENGLYTLYYDNVPMTTVRGLDILDVASIRIGGWQHQNPGTQWDNISVQGYVEPEPTFGVTGTEEISETCNVNFTSAPTGADIYIGEIYQGLTTPAVITGISAGEHVYRLSLKGYYDKIGSMVVSSELTTYVFIDFSSKSTTDCQEFNTVPHGSRIYIDGYDMRVVSPVRVCGIPPGTRMFRQIGTFTTTEKDKGCEFFLSVPKDARIIIDGVYQGEVTPSRICNIPLGTHRYILEGTFVSKV